MKRDLEKTLAIACLAAAFMTSTALAAEPAASTTVKSSPALHQEVMEPPPGRGPALPPPDMIDSGKFQMPKLTQAQKEKLDAKRREIFNNWPSMTTEERRNAHEKFVTEVRQEQMKNLTPEQKEQFTKEMARRDKKMAELRAKLAKMTPEQREAYHQKMHEKWVQKRTKNMSSEEKRAFLEQDAAREKRRADFKAQWEKMTPEQREAWKAEHRRHQGPGPELPPDFQDPAKTKTPKTN